MFFCFADPHFKKQNHRRRIINTTLLSDYAHVMRPKGKIYVITDVKELYDWEVEHLEMHPLFERVPEPEVEADPCIRFMSKGTDEARKVIRNQGSMWWAVYRKRDLTDERVLDIVDQELAPFFA
jgi:tRNA (guanine-N7-)-methyltransferase